MTIKRSTGLVDKLNGIVVDLVSNGSFTSDTTGWTQQNSATLTSVASGVSGNCLQIASPNGSVGKAYQDITTIVGKVYKVSLYFKKGTGATGSFTIGSSVSPALYFTSASLSDAGWTQYTASFIAQTTTTRLTLISDSTNTGETALFDSVQLYRHFGGFKSIMDGGALKIYKGTQAADADTGASDSNLLVTVTLNSTATGLTFDSSVAGVCGKPSGDTWSGVIAQSGTATWFRFYEAGDDTTQTSTTAARFDGTVGVSSNDMIVGSTTLTNALTFAVNGFTYTEPK